MFSHFFSPPPCIRDWIRKVKAPKNDLVGSTLLPPDNISPSIFLMGKQTMYRNLHFSSLHLTCSFPTLAFFLSPWQPLRHSKWIFRLQRTNFFFSSVICAAIWVNNERLWVSSRGFSVIPRVTLKRETKARDSALPGDAPSVGSNYNLAKHNYLKSCLKLFKVIVEFHLPGAGPLSNPVHFSSSFTYFHKFRL